MENASPLVDAYIAKQAEFARPILMALREQFHSACPDIEETIKWGIPYFEHQGMVGGIAAFKSYVSVGFWKGKLMADAHDLFEDKGRTQMTAIKIHDLDGLPDAAILRDYILEAIRLNEEGVELPVKKPSEERFLRVPDDLLDALSGNDAARDTFENFSYTNRKEYIEWLEEAKRDVTRTKRLAQAIEWMAEGKPRNWKWTR